LITVCKRLKIDSGLRWSMILLTRVLSIDWWQR